MPVRHRTERHDRTGRPDTRISDAYVTVTEQAKRIERLSRASPRVPCYTRPARKKFGGKSGI